VHRLADGRDRQRVEQAAAELDQSATKLLPGLGPGEAVLLGVDLAVPVSVRITQPVSPPTSEGPRLRTGTSAAARQGSEGPVHHPVATAVADPSRLAICLVMPGGRARAGEEPDAPLSVAALRTYCGPWTSLPFGLDRNQG